MTELKKAVREQPSQMCRGPRLPISAYHAVRPQQRSQKFDSKQDSSYHLKPKNRGYDIRQGVNS